MINNTRTALPAQILMPFLNSLDNLLYGGNIIFQKGFDKFEIKHKIC